jgi:hypothetical protein
MLELFFLIRFLDFWPRWSSLPTLGAELKKKKIEEINSKKFKI